MSVQSRVIVAALVVMLAGALFNRATDVFTKTETVDGVKCWVVEVSADKIAAMMPRGGP